MKCHETAFFYVALRACTACVPLRLSTVSKALHTQFALEFEFFWRKLLSADASLRYRMDEECTVASADGTRKICRACRHSFFDVMSSYQLERRTKKHQKIFKCVIDNCGQRFETMMQLHTHQAERCIPDRECDAELANRARAYTKCDLQSLETGHPCGWSTDQKQPGGLCGALRAHRAHCAGFHGHYECPDEWCTTSLCECIARVCRMPHGLAARESLDRYLLQLSTRVQALLPRRPYTKEDVAALVVQTRGELSRLLPCTVRFDFCSSEALREHIAEMHTTHTRIEGAAPDCTMAALVSTVTTKQDVRYSVNEQELHSASILDPDRTTVQCLYKLLRTVHNERLCNMHGVLLALVAPAHRYDGDIVGYTRRLVETHSLLYTCKHATHAAKVTDVVHDLLHLQSVCRGTHATYIYAHALPRCIRHTAHANDPVRWWTDASNGAVIGRIFGLCVQVHKCIHEYFGATALLRSLWPSTTEASLSAVHGCLRMVDPRTSPRLVYRLKILAKQPEFEELTAPSQQAVHSFCSSNVIEWAALSGLMTEMCTPRFSTSDDLHLTCAEVHREFCHMYRYDDTRATLCKLIHLPDMLRVWHISDTVDSPCVSIGLRERGEVAHATVEVLSQYEQQLTAPREPVGHQDSLLHLARVVQAAANGARGRPDPRSSRF